MKVTRNKTQQKVPEESKITGAAHSVSIESMLKSIGAVKDISLHILWMLVYNLTGITLTVGVLYALSGFLSNSIIVGAATALNRVRVVIDNVRLKFHTL